MRVASLIDVATLVIGTWTLTQVIQIQAAGLAAITGFFMGVALVSMLRREFGR